MYIDPWVGLVDAPIPIPTPVICQRTPFSRAFSAIIAMGISGPAPITLIVLLERQAS